MKEVINRADFLFIKGLNFYETFQIPWKDRFYSFVVTGEVSQNLTGLNEGDGVFVYIPSKRIYPEYSADIYSLI